MNKKILFENGWILSGPKLLEDSFEQFDEYYLKGQLFYPKVENVFNSFKIRPEKIKMVIVHDKPSIIPGIAKGYGLADEYDRYSEMLTQNILQHQPDRLNASQEVDLRAWVDQEVFFLSLSLTIGASDIQHEYGWGNFTIFVIKEICKKNPTIWIIQEHLLPKVVPYLSNVFLTEMYDKETIEHMPITSDRNYVISTPNIKNTASYIESNHFYIANRILKKSKNKQINW